MQCQTGQTIGDTLKIRDGVLLDPVTELLNRTEEAETVWFTDQRCQRRTLGEPAKMHEIVGNIATTNKRRRGQQSR
jgi:hypothetical protein